MGTGKVTVEHLGLKDCPRCDGSGDTTGLEEQSMFGQDPNAQQQMNPQQQPPNGQEQPTFTEPGKDNEQPVQNLEEPQQEQPMQQKQQMGQDQKSELERPYEQESLKKSLECNVCPKSVKQFEGFIKRKMQVLQNRRRGKKRAREGVSLLFGLPTIEQEGKKIKGILAYAGVSLNNRIYLPEELAKGDGLTLPLLLNHSNIAGAEEELDRLDDKMRGALENEEDFQIGWVKLRWEEDELTLYYEGVITDPFFQKEVDDANMAVSLGIWYDSDSQQVCNQECYTLIKGAEFREVSLVYHPGFPIATIEAVESYLKKRARQQIITENLGNNNALTRDFRFSYQFDNTGAVSPTTNIPTWINTNGTATIDNIIYTTPSTEALLQPKVSVPKVLKDEMDKRIPKNTPVQKPEDTMKEKKKIHEKKKKTGTKKRAKK